MPETGYVFSRGSANSCFIHLVYFIFKYFSFKSIGNLIFKICRLKNQTKSQPKFSVFQRLMPSENAHFSDGISVAKPSNAVLPFAKPLLHAQTSSDKI